MTIKRLVGRCLLIAIGLVVLVAIVLSGLFIRDRNEILATRETLSAVVTTPRGPVEYAEIGQGPPVLYMHGTPGGYDQMYRVLRAEYGDAGPPFRAIVPSRPGYLRTPLEAGRTFAEQADTMAALLDQLKIERAAVVGISGGGPSALQFAIRHPQRCSSLVLGSAVTQRLTLKIPWIVQQVPRDFLTWGVQYAFKSRFDAVGKVDPVAGQMWTEMLQSSFPYSEREAGADSDLALIGTMPPIAFGAIRCPTLIMHGTADDNVPFSHAELASRQIAGSRLVRFEGEDHFAGLTKRRDWEDTLLAFVKQHAPDSVLGGEPEISSGPNESRSRR